MRKWIFALIAAVLAFPVFGSAVLAEEDVVYEDEEYEVPFEVKKENADEDSVAGDYLVTPADLTVQDGKNYFEIKVTGSSMVESVSTTPNGEVDEISQDEENDTRVIGFEWNGDLTEPVIMDMHVIVPEIPDVFPGYDQNHTVRIFFDMSEVPEFEEPSETPSEPEEPSQPEEDAHDDNGENGNEEDEDVSSDNTDENQEGSNDEGDGSENEEGSNDNESEEGTEQPEEEEESKLDITNLDDGFYTIGADYLYIDKDDPSTMGNYLDDSLFLEVKNGKGEITVTITEDETVTLLQVAGKDSIESKVDGEKRHETFALDELESIFNAYVEYQAPFGDSIFEGDAEFRIVLDEDTVADSEESAKPGYESKSEPDPKEKNEDGGKKPTPTPPKPEIPEGADVAYTVDYRILQGNNDDYSIAEDFFTGVAVLIERDGQKYVQLTSTAPEMIEYLKSDYGVMQIVQYNSDGSAVYQVAVPDSFDLGDIFNLEMAINVPGLYNTTHQTRVVFDESTLKEIDAADIDTGIEKEVKETDDGNPSGNGSNGNGGDDSGDNDGKPNPNTPSKPDFEDPNGNGAPGNGSDGDDGLNPKTGEETNIMLYVLLMLASAVPLVIKARKHFA